VAEAAANPFSILCVTEDAPLEVIRAAYKALAGIYHPDHGGNEQQMADLNAAYTEIRNLREH
jgi:curved DNA-binding protein CbpA